MKKHILAFIIWVFFIALTELPLLYFRPVICVADIVILDTYIILSILCLMGTKLIIKIFNKSTKNKSQGFIETPTIKNYMKSHLITNITDGTEELWDESMGEIPYEYYNMIVVGDDGKGNILACHFGKMARKNRPIN